MSELELKCPDCGYSEKGPDVPFPDDQCPNCGLYMDHIVHLNEEEAKAAEEILKKPRQELPASPLKVCTCEAGTPDGRHEPVCPCYGERER